MKKALKYIATTITIIILLLAIAITLLVTFINPNDFKGEISHYVAKKTGRELIIKGKIGWSFYPWLGIYINDVQLGNPTGFISTVSTRPFLRVGQAEFKIRLLPLFRGKAEIGTVKLNGLTLNLITNKQGQSNWQRLIKTKSLHPTKTSLSNNSTRKEIALTISKFHVSNAHINIINQETEKLISLRKVNFIGHHISINKAFPVKLSFIIFSNNPDISAKLFSTAAITVNPKQRKYTIKQLKITGDLINKKYTQSGVPFYMNSNIIINLNNKKLAINNLTAKLANVTIQGNLQGTNILSTPILNGKISIAQFNLKTFVNTFGMHIHTTNKAALQKASLKTQFQLSEKFIKLKPLRATLDNSVLTGSANYRNLDERALDFTISINKINVNSYLPLRIDSKIQPIKKITSKAKNKVTQQNTQPNVKFISNLAINGNIKIGKLHIAKLNAEQISAQITGKNGIIYLSPITAKLYQGNSFGNISINLRDNVPHYIISESLTNIQLSPLLDDLANTKKITGTAALTFNLTALGTTNLLATLNGTTKFSIKNGILKGIDISYEIHRAKAFIKQVRTSKNPFTQPQSMETKSSDQTPFGEITGSGKINKGILTNNDLLIQSPSFKATGQGIINLATKTLNYQLNVHANIIKQVETFPLLITGTFAQPRVTLDATTLAKNVLQSQVEKKIEKQAEKIEQKLKEFGEDIKEKFEKLF